MWKGVGIASVIFIFEGTAFGWNGHRGNNYMMHGGGWIFFMWILLLIIIGILIYFLIRSRSLKGPGALKETPLDILKKRYAKGEITKEEFERIKKDLGA